MVRIFAALLCATVMLQSGTALAADSGKGNEHAQPEAVKRLFDCRKIEEAATRLDCYDREAAAVEMAADTNELFITDPKLMKDAKRGPFGLSLPKLSSFGGGDPNEEEISSIESTLQSASVTAGGKLLLVLDDGARWLQSDSRPVLGSPGAGDPVTIKRAAMGSYIAKIGGKRAFRVKRIK